MARASGYIIWNKICFPQLCGSIRNSGVDSPLFFRIQSVKGNGIEPARRKLRDGLYLLLSWGVLACIEKAGCFGKRVIAATQIFVYYLAERKCECREIFSRAGNERLRNKKEGSYKPGLKISLPAVLWKEGVSTEVNNGGRSPCGGEKQEELYNPSHKISLPAVLWKEGVTTEVINGRRNHVVAE